MITFKGFLFLNKNLYKVINLRLFLEGQKFKKNKILKKNPSPMQIENHWENHECFNKRELGFLPNKGNKTLWA